MIGKTAIIPLSSIDRIRVYVNWYKKSMEQIQSEFGCDYILNAGLFNMSTFVPTSYLVSNGKTLCNAGNPYGYSFDDNKIAFSYANNVNYKDFVGGYPPLIANSVNVLQTTPAGLTGNRGRSAIGLTKDALVLRCVPDVSGSSDYTLNELCADMLSYGCENAINLDGGGSSQCNFAGDKITSTRRVHSFILVWVKQSLKHGSEDEKMQIKCTSKTQVYDKEGNLEKGRYIDKGDICTISNTINDNLLILVSYPVSTGSRAAYLKSLANFTRT